MHPIYVDDVWNNILRIKLRLTHHFSNKQMYYRAFLFWVIVPNFIAGSIYVYSELEINNKIIRLNRPYLFYSEDNYEFYPFSISQDVYEGYQLMPRRYNFMCFSLLYLNNISFDFDFGRYFSYAYYCNSQFLSPISKNIKEKCPENSNDLDIASTILSFVQDKSEIFSMKYLSDGEGDYPKYPVETLVEGGGDCEDLSILFSSLCSTLGYETIVLCLCNVIFEYCHVYCAITFDEFIEDDTVINNYINFTSDLSNNGKFGDIPAKNDSMLYNYVDINSSSYLINSLRVEKIHDLVYPNQTTYQLFPTLIDYTNSEISNPRFALNGKIYYPVECTKYGWNIGDVSSEYYFSPLYSWGVF